MLSGCPIVEASGVLLRLRRGRKQAQREIYRGNHADGGEAQMQPAFEGRGAGSEAGTYPHLRRICRGLVGLGEMRVPQEAAQAV